MWFQVKSVSLLSSSHKGAIEVDRPGMKGLRYFTMPKNSWSSVTFVGAGRACMALTLSGSGWTPSASQRQLKKLTAGAFTCVFLWVEY